MSPAPCIRPWTSETTEVNLFILLSCTWLVSKGFKRFEFLCKLFNALIKDYNRGRRQNLTFRSSELNNFIEVSSFVDNPVCIYFPEIDNRVQ